MTLAPLLREIRACTLCAAHLPLGPRPVIQAAANARILIVGQAPGTAVHRSGRPFDDPSGDRLRSWLGIDRELFYDANTVACVPMGFCYPGKGTGGDLPPRPECAETWRARVLAQLGQVELTVLVGRYAINWHLHPPKQQTLGNIVRDWQAHWPQMVALPHPSPRNTHWLRQHPWVEAEIVPALQRRVKQLLTPHTSP